MSVTLLGTAFGILGTILAVPAAVVASIFVEKLWFERLEDRDKHANNGKEEERSRPSA